MEKQYSGKNSFEFWQEINALSGPEAELVYVMACALQDMEHRVYQILDMVERKSPSPFTRGKL